MCIEHGAVGLVGVAAVAVFAMADVGAKFNEQLVEFTCADVVESEGLHAW